MRSDGSEQIVAVFNFSDKIQKKYRLNLPGSGTLTLLLDSNRDIYGGKNHYDAPYAIQTKKDSVTLTLSPYSAMYFLVS